MHKTAFPHTPPPPLSHTPTPGQKKHSAVSCDRHSFYGNNDQLLKSACVAWSPGINRNSTVKQKALREKKRRKKTQREKKASIWPYTDNSIVCTTSRGLFSFLSFFIAAFKPSIVTSDDQESFPFGAFITHWGTFRGSDIMTGNCLFLGGRTLTLML